MSKNALPEEFSFPSPAPSNMSRKVPRDTEERDILDDLVIKEKVQQPAWKSKRSTINEMEAISTQQAAFKASIEE